MNASHSSSFPEGAKRTEAYYGIDNVVNTESQFFSNAKRRIDACMNFTIPPLAARTEQIKKIFMNAKNRGVKTRYLTEITNDNIEYCKEMMENVDELKHLEGIMSNFVLSESEYLAPVVVAADVGGITPEIIYCNINSFVEQQQYFFDILWNKAETAEQKIREIEERVEADFIEIIRDPYKVQKLAFDLIAEAKEEILIIFSTVNAFHRQTKSGTIKLVIEAASRGIKVSILTPFDERAKKIVEELEVQYDSDSGNAGLDNKSCTDDNKHEHHGRLNSVTKLKIRPIEPQLQTKISILIVDRKYSLAVELKDDNKDTSDKAMGLASYSNSKSTVSSYVSIFESLCRQLDLYEQLRESNTKQGLLIDQLRVHDASQKEFINVAAHELRTPVQPILSLSNILLTENGDIKQYREMLEIIRRNAVRLSRLSKDILDIAKIESNFFILETERVNLNELIRNVIDDYESQIRKLNEVKVKLNLVFISNHDRDDDIFVNADRSRLSQVLDNFLSNAVKFTREGSITIFNTIMKKDGNDDSRHSDEMEGKEVIVSVKDTGVGIEPEIYSRLFDKFTTRSHQGTGLGLYISKSIIEAHGGRIWAENNANGKGATFSFSLPITN